MNSVIDGDHLELDNNINFFPRELTSKSDLKKILFFIMLVVKTLVN